MFSFFGKTHPFDRHTLEEQISLLPYLPVVSNFEADVPTNQKKRKKNRSVIFLFVLTMLIDGARCILRQVKKDFPRVKHNENIMVTPSLTLQLSDFQKSNPNFRNHKHTSTK